MSTALAPDIEIVVGTYLRAHPAVAAITPRVVSVTPTNRDTPWVRLAQLDGRGDYPHHLLSHLIQCDCYAGKANSRGEAKALGLAVFGALVDMRGVLSAAVVTGVEPSFGPSAADDDFEPARERQIVQATVWAHG